MKDRKRLYAGILIVCLLIGSLSYFNFKLHISIENSQLWVNARKR